jgi:hypothetical protein
MSWFLDPRHTLSKIETDLLNKCALIGIAYPITLFENQLVFVLYLGLVVLCSLLIKEMSNINLTPLRTKKDLEQISEQTIYVRAQTTTKDRRSLRSSKETIPSSEPPRLSSSEGS